MPRTPILNACPFCGGSPEHRGVNITCTTCGVVLPESPKTQSLGGVTSVWNNRDGTGSSGPRSKSKGMTAKDQSDLVRLAMKAINSPKHRFGRSR